MWFTQTHFSSLPPLLESYGFLPGSNCVLILLYYGREIQTPFWSLPSSWLSLAAEQRLQLAHPELRSRVWPACLLLDFSRLGAVHPFEFMDAAFLHGDPAVPAPSCAPPLGAVRDVGLPCWRGTGSKGENKIKSYIGLFKSFKFKLANHLFCASRRRFAFKICFVYAYPHTTVTRVKYS